MKKIIFSMLLLSISFSVVEAQPVRKPSAGQIKKLIKKMLYKHKTVTYIGIYDYKDKSKCKNIKVNRIKILKIGRVSSNYYVQSGSYIDSDFKVKFTIQGSCNLTPPFRINDDEYTQYKYHPNKHKPVMPMDLSGRVPFRNIPFEIHISTDDYGDWYANSPSTAREKDRSYSDGTEKYLKNLYYRKNGKKVKAWNKKQAYLKSRMSDGAESGYNVIQFDHLYTREVKALLDSQPKKTREFVYGSYWKLMHKGNHADTDRFLREVIKQLKAQKPRATRAKTSVRVNKPHSKNSLLGDRIR